MSDNYDSILKEKKVYEDYTPTHTTFKKFLAVGFFFVIVIIIISYIIYYNTFLSGENILMNDISKLVDSYSVIFDEVNNYDFSANYMISGDAFSDGNRYKYTFIRDNNKTKRTFINGDKSLSFYYDGDSNYIKLSNFDNYISVDNEFLSFDDYENDYDILNNNVFNYFNYILFEDSVMDIYNRFYTIDNYNYLVNDVRNNFLDFVSDNKYSKKFYFYNGRPVIKIDLSLNSNDINKILSNGANNLMVKDSYDVIITARNDAIMNDIKNIKIIINNKTNNTRVVVVYDGKDLYYTDVDCVDYKYNLVTKGKGFSLKVYKGDVLYSALEGGKEENKYVYNYQFIDKLERYTLEVGSDNNKYNYKFIANNEGKIREVSVTGEYSDVGAIDEGILNVLKYRDIEDGYRNIINDSLIKYLK